MSIATDGVVISIYRVIDKSSTSTYLSRLKSICFCFLSFILNLEQMAVLRWEIVYFHLDDRDILYALVQLL